MAIARSNLVDPHIPYAYHLVSRCVRRSFLCGKDAVSGKNYNHRKAWIVDRINQLAPHFPIEVYAYSIMSNHLHMVVYYDPNACKDWSPEEVAQRWCAVCPEKKRNGTIDEDRTALLFNRLMTDECFREHKREQLGSLSTFMKLLKQPIAIKANQEDGCSGHFFEQRFYSGVLLSEAAIIAAMAYVELNPVRARLATQLKDIRHTSITQRIEALRSSTVSTTEALNYQNVQPVLSGLASEGTRSICIAISLKEYIYRLETVLNHELRRSLESSPTKNKAQRWVQHVQMLGHKQRAYGPKTLIQDWLRSRNMQFREVALAE